MLGVAIDINSLSSSSPYSYEDAVT